MMTVDEITAEVESRRESMTPDDWTKVNPDDADSEDQGTTLVDEEPDEALFDDEEQATLSADDEDEPGKPITMKGRPDHTETRLFYTYPQPIAAKWIKGALIGAGSFGKVYLGMDASSGLLMAVKQVELPTGSAPNEERKKSMLSALEREIELLKDLQHDNIVQYLCLYFQPVRAEPSN
jgi:mitogen-activated protein kinase kinase kinase